MLPTRKQWRNWSLPSKYSLFGLVLGLLGLAPTLFMVFPLSEPKVPSAFEAAIFNAQSEIRENIRCLDGLRKQIDRELEWPICQQNHVSIDFLFQNHFFGLGDKAYGEDNTLIWQWKKINHAIGSINSSRTLRGLREREMKEDMSMRDLYFQQAFLVWYLDCHLGRCANSINSDDTSPEVRGYQINIGINGLRKRRQIMKGNVFLRSMIGLDFLIEQI